MSGELLLEIGTEEIPADFLKQGILELRRLGRECLKKNRIGLAGELYAYGTPRRLTLCGHGIDPVQEDLVQEITGPPKSVAYDSEGNPTKAAFGFAEKQGVSVEELDIIETEKGPYIYVKRLTRGKRTPEILSQVLPVLIGDIPWPKSMRWNSMSFDFVRPIHWLLALFDGEVIPFELAGVRSGCSTRGHRFMSPDPVEVKDVDDYFRKIEERYVSLDQEERQKTVHRLVREEAEKVGGNVGNDTELTETVANLVEYPSVVCGSFDKAFLDLPDPVLITAMKEHQKYFSVYDSSGRVMPYFIAVNNTVTRDDSVVRKGHERVLRARLSDAQFFYKEDIKRPLKERLEGLKSVIYQAHLGTSYAKVQRFSRLAEYLCGILMEERLDNVRTAAELCKCDLVCQMVAEFPSLQGVMGREYARIEGYPEEVCAAIADHYLPVRSGGELPESEEGAIVGVADRLDTIAGCFAVGLEPSGNTDPFALRRHALAVLRIIEKMEWDLSLKDVMDRALSILPGDIGFEKEKIFSAIMVFLKERYKQMMLRSGYETELLDAIISVDFDRVNHLHPRIEQLKRFVSESEEFEALATTFKRVKNILRKEENTYAVDPSLFKDPCESYLWKAYRSVKGDIGRFIEKKAYYEALNLMSRLREPVNGFFDGVEILTKESEALRNNRVGVLQHLEALFMRVADLSRFAV